VEAAPECSFDGLGHLLGTVESLVEVIYFSEDWFYLEAFRNCSHRPWLAWTCLQVHLVRLL